MVSESTFTKYEECMSERAVIVTQKACEQRFSERIKTLQQQDPAEPNLIQVDKMAAFIGEMLIFARCPNPQCEIQMLDFEACSAIKCDPAQGGCGIYFCAWCLQSQEDRGKCHNHVRTCSFNPSGNLYPPQPHPQIWKTVMNELARKRVKEYIQSEAVPETLRKHVYDECRKRHPEIQLQHFGQVVSDGYRPIVDVRAPRQGGYEENITALMNMGLANRARAEQALEVMQNNLHDAASLLLAIQHV
jgi:hypothetical protein